ncbi:hypothetical protein EJB05_40552, partial [Eragrostis curvula]
MATRRSSPPGWRAVATDPTAANLKHNEKPVTHLASAPNLALPPHPPAAEPRPPSTTAHLALDQIPPSPSSTRRNHCSIMAVTKMIAVLDGVPSSCCNDFQVEFRIDFHVVSRELQLDDY